VTDTINSNWQRNWRKCPTCKGIGIKDGGTSELEDQCETCGGLGSVAINLTVQLSDAPVAELPRNNLEIA